MKKRKQPDCWKVGKLDDTLKDRYVQKPWAFANWQLRIDLRKQKLTFGMFHWRYLLFMTKHLFIVEDIRFIVAFGLYKEVYHSLLELS